MKLWARKPVVFVLLTVVATFTTGGRTLAQDADDDAVEKLSAAFVLNFTRYTQWPETALEEEGPIRVAVIGESDVSRYLRLLAADEMVHDREVVVTTIAAPRWSGDAEDDGREAERFVAAVRKTHVVFIPRSEREHIQSTLRAAADHPILTICRAENFVDDGGMLGLYLSRNRMVFEANRTAAESAGLKISSKVLKLAQRVREDR